MADAELSSSIRQRLSKEATLLNTANLLWTRWLRCHRRRPLLPLEHALRRAL
jgi:hypothetical protein